MTAAPQVAVAVAPVSGREQKCAWLGRQLLPTGLVGASAQLVEL